MAGYTPSYSGSNITNTLNTEYTVTATKTWEDDGNKFGTRPDSVTLQLYANGAAVDGKTLPLSASNADSKDPNVWTGSFTGLPEKDSAGKAITYTVEETAVPGGYTADTTKDLNVTNTLTKDKSITVDKTWVDGGNAGGTARIPSA